MQQTATRAPGGSTLRTVAAYTEQFITIKPSELGLPEGNWDVEVFLRQDPVAPVAIRAQSGDSVSYYTWCNNKYFSSTERGFHRPSYDEITSAYSRFREGRQAYRITALGITGTLVSSALNNSGIVTAAQYSLPQTEAVATAFYQDDTDLYGAAYVVPSTTAETLPVKYTFTNYKFRLAPIVRFYAEGPWSTDAIMQATHSFTGPLKEGFYMPLKLYDDHHMISLNTTYALGGNNGAWRSNLSASWTNAPSEYTPLCSAWPYYIDPTTVARGSDSQRYTNGMIRGFYTAADTIGHISCRGINYEAGLNLILRMSVEILPELSSAEAAYAEGPSPPDDLAVSMYRELVARFPDAYPADYNDRGKLLSMISGMAKKLAPHLDKALAALSLAPGWVGGAAKAGRSLVKAGMAKPVVVTVKPPAQSKRAKKKKGKIQSTRKSKSNNDTKVIVAGSSKIGGRYLL